MHFSTWLTASVHCLALAAATLLAGCQNNRAVIPPPGGILQGGDAYYTPPLGATGGNFRPGSTGAPVSLAPGGVPLSSLSPASTATPANSTGAASPIPDTYDVTSRVAVDSQPIRIVEGATATPNSYAAAPGGMPVNDGTLARSWQSNSGTPQMAGRSSFGGLRGTASDPRSSGSFSGQEGQWRSRSSYEGTERR